MRELEFNILTKNEFNEYHLSASSKKWLDKTIWTDKQELYKTLFASYENQQSQFHKLFYNFAYYNCTHEENIFIYERLIWDLVKNLNIYCTVNFRTASFLMSNDLPFDKVSWEYEIEYQANLDYTEVIFQDKGFVPARTSWIKPPTPRWNNDDENKTAVFKIDSFNTFIKAIFSCIMDDFGSLNFYCLKEDNKERLIKTLKSDEEPKLNTILDSDDIFITLFLGADEGFQDYLLIKSKSDIKESIDKITKRVNKGIRIYETELKEIDSFEQLMKLIEKSFELKIHYS